MARVNPEETRKRRKGGRRLGAEGGGLAVLIQMNGRMRTKTRRGIEQRTWARAVARRGEPWLADRTNVDKHHGGASASRWAKAVRIDGRGWVRSTAIRGLPPTAAVQLRKRWLLSGRVRRISCGGRRLFRLLLWESTSSRGTKPGTLRSTDPAGCLWRCLWTAAGISVVGRRLFKHRQ